MASPISRLGIFLIVFVCGLQAAWPQGRPPSSGSPGRTTTPSRTPTGPDPSFQTIFISGKVVLEGGGSPGEPVAIERICNGAVRREGYTDFKGQFEIQLGVSPTFQDASENGGQGAPMAPRVSSQSGSRRPLDLTGCELRASHAGFQSSTVMIRAHEEARYEVGTIFIKRVGDAKGSTVSITSMGAPKDAQQSFEKAERASDQKKFADAEKELAKAVRIYPQFAAAWSKMADIHQQQGQLQQARDEYSKALAADPQYVNPNFGLALIAVQEKNWQEAARFSGQVMQLNGYAFPVSYFYNAAANYNLGQYEAAEESARKYKALDTEHRHPDVALLLGNILVRKKDYAGAVQQIREYLALVPNDPGADRLKAQMQQLEELSVSSKN